MKKKELERRILDVAAGAGLQWDDNYWDGQCAETLGRFLHGLDIAFVLNHDNAFLVHHNNLDNYDDLNSLVDFFWAYRDQLS